MKHIDLTDFGVEPECFKIPTFKVDSFRQKNLFDFGIKNPYPQQE